MISLSYVSTLLFALNVDHKLEISNPKFGTFKSVQKEYESTIRLLNEKGEFFCTASVIDDNYALTAAHCIRGSFGFISGKKILINDDTDVMTDTIAYPAAFDAYRDVGFIKGDFSKFKDADVDFVGSYIQPNMLLISCGFPAGQKDKYCSYLQLVGNENFQYKTVGLPIFKGMSGGPVVDLKSNKVIGVNSAVINDFVIVSPLVGVLDSLRLK